MPSGRSDKMSEEVTRCKVCGRKLTDPKSVELGVGPVCMKKIEEDWQKLEEELGEEEVRKLENRINETLDKLEVVNESTK